MATKRLQKITEAFVDGDTLDQFIKLGKKVGITTMDDFVKFGEIFKGEKNISMTDALKKYCKVKGIKTDDLSESKQLTEGEDDYTWKSIEDPFDCIQKFLVALGYGNKDFSDFIEDERSSGRWAKKAREIALIYKRKAAAVKGDLTTRQKAKAEYDAAEQALNNEILAGSKQLGWIGIRTKDESCNLSVISPIESNLKAAQQLFEDVPNLYYSEVYKKRGAGNQVLYAIDIDTTTVETEAAEWMDCMHKYMPKGQQHAYFKDGADFDRVKATRKSLATIMSGEDDAAAAEVAASSDFPEDDFSWGDED